MGETAYGTFSTDGNGNFHGTYTMPDSTQKTIVGRFSSAVPSFNVPVGTVTYNSPLDGTHTASGRVGSTDESIQLDDGVVLGGRLMPPLDRAYNIAGQGSWSSTFD
jgi:hypothetical protein